MTKNSTPPVSMRRRTSPSHPGTTWTSSRYTVTPSGPWRCGNRRTCSSSNQPRSATVRPASRSSSSRSSSWDSGRAPSSRRAARHCARNDVLPLRRTPMTANALLGMAGSRTSRGVRRRAGTASDSSSLAPRISRDIVTMTVTIYGNLSLRKGQIACGGREMACAGGRNGDVGVGGVSSDLARPSRRDRLVQVFDGAWRGSRSREHAEDGQSRRPRLGPKPRTSVPQRIHRSLLVEGIQPISRPRSATAARGRRGRCCRRSGRPAPPPCRAARAAGWPSASARGT